MNDRTLIAAEVKRSPLLSPVPVGGAREGPCERFGPLAAHLLGAPASFSVLLDGPRYLLVSSHGLPEAWGLGNELPIVHAFCNAVVASGAPLAIADWRDYPSLAAVAEPPIPGAIACVGVPLKLQDGIVVGVLAVGDPTPRLWSQSEIDLLQKLGRLLVEEVELRTEIRDTRQQSEAERMMLLTLLAHEFRTPLTSIKGFVELILDGEVGQVSEQQREFLAIVARNAERLIDLVNDRITVARPDEAAAGGYPQDPTGGAPRPSLSQ